ncbi:cell division protein FtsZ [Novosphingobium kaempferiae]|uniref:cell division protein FtsZ n=1 Tax=Novosphingobium kaempferiae TaxID=2896849 RepID=UPI001E4E3920|nr:cell division protein FtsZ [Novosphingobium kaempferiae]
MSINIGPPAIEELRPRILVIGVGGAGGNAIANMIHAQIEGVDFVVANTDAQALNNSIAETRIQLGPDITQGLGAGARPEVGRAAAEETREELERLLDGVHMVFIAAGMGGGTGTGAAPIIAQAAREKGVLTVGVVSKPFMFEGTRRMRAADSGIEELQKHVDTLIVIPNQNLFLVAKAETTFKEAFTLADEVLQQGVRSITDLMIMPGLINLDFADVRSVMGEMGKAMMGTGEGEGPNRALEAAERAIANPLLDGVSMQGAKGVIISIIGGDDMKLLEVDEAANHIRELVDPDANIIWGSAFNPDLQGKIRVSVVATGIEQTTEMAEIASRPLNLGASRGPVRPTYQAPAAPVYQAPVTPTPAPAPAPVAQPAPAPEPAPFASPSQAYEPSAELELGAEDEAQDAPATGGFAGLRGIQKEPLDLSFEAPVEPAPAPRPRTQDELLFDGGQSAPVPPRPKPAGGGSTLFERMTNLSRPRPGADAGSDEDEGDGGSISIPRFLGRQNNQ